MEKNGLMRMWKNRYWRSGNRNGWMEEGGMLEKEKKKKSGFAMETSYGGFACEQECKLRWQRKNIFLICAKQKFENIYLKNIQKN